MPRQLITIMTSRAYSLVKNIQGAVICHLCRKEVEIGTKFIRFKSGRSSPAKRYHLSCGKKLNII